MKIFKINLMKKESNNNEKNSFKMKLTNKTKTAINAIKNKTKSQIKIKMKC